MSNLKRAKATSIAWNKASKKKENKDLSVLKRKLLNWHKLETSGNLTEELKEEYKSLDLKRRKILQNREHELRIRSRSL